MKIALAQIEIQAGQPDLNTAKILKYIDMAKAQNCNVVIFPAAAISGVYFSKQPALLRECEDCVKEVVAASSNIAVVFGNGDKMFTAKDGKLIKGEEIFDFQIKISAYHFITNEILERDKINSALAVEKKFPLVFVNSVGIQNNGKTIYTFDGGSTIYNSKGEVVKRLPFFTETFETITTAKIEQLPALDTYDEKPVAQIYRALSFGVEKFLQQIHMNKIVIGVSGGIDSAVAAALYTKVIGKENVFLVNMPSVYNSITTRNLSERLANNLGCKYAVVSIQNSVDSTVRQLELNLDLRISNFVKENLQARDRSGRVLATLAAALKGGFTCNANKAESTIGYATMYGDSAGVLAATADLWKFQVYELANYLNEEIYGREVIPQGIIDIVPSAELSEAQNVDEGKGDPLHYDYHDYLFRAFVENSATPEDILNWYVEKNLEQKIGCEAGLVQKYFPRPKNFIEDLEKWWTQFQGIAVAKRIQAPPLIAVGKRPFGSFVEMQNTPHFTKKYFELKKFL